MPLNKKKRRISVPLLVAILLVASGLITTVVLLAKKPFAATSQTTRTYTVTKEVVQNIIEISGTVEAAQSQELQAAGDGTVVAVHVSQGDHVKKGQVLLELDTTEQEYELAKLDYNMAQTRISGNAKELELQKLQRKSLLKKLEDRKITASFDGLLADFNAAVGDYLEAKDSVGTLVERSYLKSYVEVVETDAPKLAANQIVYCTFPAYGDTPVEGYVVSYPQVGTLTSRGASIVEAEIRIDNPPSIILPNYSFTGEIEISPPETLLLVEKEAVGFKDGKTFVQKITRDGKPEEIQVTAEPYGTTHVRITEGLVTEGDILAALSAPPVSGTRPSTMERERKQQEDVPLGGPSGMGGGPGGMGGGGMPPMR